MEYEQRKKIYQAMVESRLRKRRGTNFLVEFFWLSLLRDVFDVDEPENFIRFEVPIPHGFIDGLIDSTKVLIEQKSSSVNLDDEEIFRQAKRYNDAPEFSRKTRWIVTCNFKEFRVFDMDKKFPEREPLKIFLFELLKKFPSPAIRQRIFLIEFIDLEFGKNISDCLDAIFAVQAVDLAAVVSESHIATSNEHTVENFAGDEETSRLPNNSA